MPLTVDLVDDEPPVYIQIAEEARHMRDLGMTYYRIGRALGVDAKTVAKAIKWVEELGPDERTY